MSSNTCSIVDLVKLITRPAAVMNMISHSHAYSLYPKETFDNMRSLVVRSHDSRPKMVQALEKYKQRGWDVVTSISVEEASDSQKTFGRRYRFVGDSASWVYPLPDIPCVFFALFFCARLTNSGQAVDAKRGPVLIRLRSRKRIYVSADASPEDRILTEAKEICPVSSGLLTPRMLRVRVRTVTTTLNRD